MLGNSYLHRLTMRLSAGVEQIPEPIRDQHVQFIAAAQKKDGGFGGREGEGDLYYTGFALRSLSILGALDGQLAKNAARFLRSRLAGQETVVDFLSLIYSAALLDFGTGIDVFEAATTDWRDHVANKLNSLRRDDGGFAKGEEGKFSSTYHTFLVLLCLELIERPIPDEDKIVTFIRSQTADKGGFREIRVSKRAGTNPTAAAIGALSILNAIDDDIEDDTVEFLSEMQTDEGGLRANTRIPIADLLSTFTGLLTLSDLNAADEIDIRAAMRYAIAMRQDHGGFLGAHWDQTCDVEYTFYGIGTIALLNGIPPNVTNES